MNADADVNVGCKSHGQTAAAMRRARLHRWVRKLHAWAGAWGAIAAVIFGLSGFVQNHRGVLRLPQGAATEVSSVVLPVPDEVRGSPDALRGWLQQTQGIALEARPEGRLGRGGPPAGGRPGGTGRWTFAGGNVRTTWQAEYRPGEDTLSLRKSVQSPLAALLRLHKGVGGGLAWILLSDSFAIGLVALGVSGLIMWSRGRSPRQLAASILGAAVAVLALVVGGAVI